MGKMAGHKWFKGNRMGTVQNGGDIGIYPTLGGRAGMMEESFGNLGL